MNIEEFYAQDERRRRSEEIEFGTEWHDGAGARFELAWVADTGELYVMSEPGGPVAEDLFGDLYGSSVPLDQISVVVVGWVPDRAGMEEVFQGWEDAMEAPNSVAWIAERLRSCSVPRQAPST
jgi:hypothetical protein